LIAWNVEVRSRRLKQIVAKRLDKQAEDAPQPLEEKNFVLEEPEQGKTVIDEVKELISLPRHRARTDVMGEESVLLPEIVVQELHDYVTTTAAMYNPNDLHNFEHAFACDHVRDNAPLAHRGSIRDPTRG
jgi:hypothetical protein